MPDKVEEVWPLPASARKMSLRSVNGIGFEMKGFTRADSSGRYFGTRWFTIIGLPVVPRHRFYLCKESSSTASRGNSSSTTTRYSISGQAHLRGSEILRTYVFCWLFGPAVVIVPIVLAVLLGDVVPVGVIVGFVLVWMIAAIFLLVILLDKYHKKWGPVRSVRWVQDDRQGSAQRTRVNQAP